MILYTIKTVKMTYITMLSKSHVGDEVLDPKEGSNQVNADATQHSGALS